jgi:hypothetical protein
MYPDYSDLNIGELSRELARDEIDREKNSLVAEAIEEKNEIVDLVKKRFGKQKKPFLDRFSSETIRTLAIERNGAVIRISNLENPFPGVVDDKTIGHAMDLGAAKPVTFIEDGKVSVGFVVDGDRGVGINLNPEKSVYMLSVTSKMAHAFIDAAKFAAAYTEDITTKERAKMIFIGLGIGLILGFFFHI